MYKLRLVAITDRKLVREVPLIEEITNNSTSTSNAAGLMTTIYKILFEVQVLTRFYLTNQDNTTIFEGTAAARQLFLNDGFLKNARSISSDLRYAVPPSMQPVFSKYRLKLLPGYSGFKVAIEVNPVILGGNIKAYQPVVTLPADVDIQVLLLRKDHIIDIYTNRRLRTSIKATGYFSNDDVPAPKHFHS